MSPNRAPRAFCQSRRPYSHVPRSSIVRDGVIRPASSAASAVTGLNVEADG